jgi:hypothetical protein
MQCSDVDPQDRKLSILRVNHKRTRSNHKAIAARKLYFCGIHSSGHNPNDITYNAKHHNSGIRNMITSFCSNTTTFYAKVGGCSSGVDQGVSCARLRSDGTSLRRQFSFLRTVELFQTTIPIHEKVKVSVACR